MLKEIRQVTFSDSFIFVSDIHKLLQFDRKGNFVRQIGNKGRGPGEYMSVWDFRLDNNSEIIYITFTSSGEMLTFDFNGNFLKSFNLPNRSFHFILKDTDELMFHQPNIPGQTVDTIYSWYITDINGNTKSRIVNNVKRVRKPGYTVHDTPLYTFNNIAYFMEFGTDTLYFFDNSNKLPYAVVNFGDQKIDIDPDIQNQQVTEILKQKFWIFSILEDRDNMYFTLCRGLGGPFVSCLFNKQSSEVTFLENNRFKNDVDGGPDFWPKEIYNDSIFIDYIDAIRILDLNLGADKTNNNNLWNLKSKIIESSNPVLMIIK